MNSWIQGCLLETLETEVGDSRGRGGAGALSSPAPGSAGPKTARTEGPRARGLDSQPADPAGSRSGLHGGNVGMQGAGKSGDQGAGDMGHGEPGASH